MVEGGIINKAFKLEIQAD